MFLLNEISLSLFKYPTQPRKRVSRNYIFCKFFLFSLNFREFGKKLVTRNRTKAAATRGDGRRTVILRRLHEPPSARKLFSASASFNNASVLTAIKQRMTIRGEVRNKLDKKKSQEDMTQTDTFRYFPFSTSVFPL